MISHLIIISIDVRRRTEADDEDKCKEEFTGSSETVTGFGKGSLRSETQTLNREEQLHEKRRGDMKK
jgi:hypothetical protein